MRFAAPYDRTTMIVSAAVMVFFLVIAVVLESIGVGILAGAVLLLAYAYSPRSYAIAGDELAIERLMGRILVPLGELQEARVATVEDFRGCVRLWGSGGLFGYYGWFRTARLGKCRWYVTDRSKAVVVRAGTQVVVLSPEDPETFLGALHPLVRPEPPDPFRPQTRIGSAGTNSIMKVIAGAGVVLGLAGVIFAVSYAPGPPSYTLTGDTLTIHDRFYPVTLRADAVDVEGIRIVDLNTDSQWRPTVRTNGFSNQHYHSGWYRVGSGQKVRLYRADGTRLVLLPPKGTGAAVLLEAVEPERFVAEIQRQWTGRS